MAVTVYVWDPMLKVQYFAPLDVKDGGLQLRHASVGHAALKTPDCYISWAGGSKFCSWEEDCRKYRSKDAEAKQVEERTIVIHNLDEKAILHFYDRMFHGYPSKPTYFFFGLNCAKMVALALMEGGALKRQTGIYRLSFLNLIWTPLDVYRYALALSSSPG